MTRNTFRIVVRKYDPFENAIKRTWEAFAKQENITLELDAPALDLHPLQEALFDNDELRRGDTDVAFLVTDWMAACKEKGILADLAPMISANPPDDFPIGWMASLLGTQQFGDQIFGLPYHDGPECLIYRKDLFDDPENKIAYRAKFGSELRLPQTWEEFHQMARFFTRPERGLYGTVFAAFPDGHNTVYDFCLQLWTRGGELFNSEGKLNLNTPPAIQALEFYRAILTDPTAIHPQSREFDSVKSGLAFAAGEVAMMINWFGFASMSETIPDSKVRGAVDIGVLPSASGSNSASLNVYWVLGIGAGSPHKEIAYKFLRYCASAEADKALTLDGAIGCRRSTWQDSEVNRVIPFYHRLEALHANARELPRLTNWAELAAKIDQVVMRVITTDQPVADIVQELG